MRNYVGMIQAKNRR